MVADTTISKIVAETTKIICEKMKEECLPFPTEARWKKAAEDFEKYWNFPLCCGSIDGKHVEVVVRLFLQIYCFIYSYLFHFIHIILVVKMLVCVQFRGMRRIDQRGGYDLIFLDCHK
jgi:hypothetical protein